MWSWGFGFIAYKALMMGVGINAYSGPEITLSTFCTSVLTLASGEQK